jgi:hypothetical protein
MGIFLILAIHTLKVVQEEMARLPNEHFLLKNIILYYSCHVQLPIIESHAIVWGIVPFS